jgi:hypothetical protein
LLGYSCPPTHKVYANASPDCRVLTEVAVAIVYERRHSEFQSQFKELIERLGLVYDINEARRIESEITTCPEKS